MCVCVCVCVCACGVMVTVIGNEHNDLSSNPGQGCFAFHIVLIPLRKVFIQLFSLQLWVDSRADWDLLPWYGNWSRRKEILNSNLLNST